LGEIFYDFVISIRDFVFRCLRIIVVSALFWSPPCRRRVFSLEALRQSLQPSKFLIITIYKPFNCKKINLFKVVHCFIFHQRLNKWNIFVLKLQADLTLLNWLQLRLLCALKWGLITLVPAWGHVFRDWPDLHDEPSLVIKQVQSSVHSKENLVSQYFTTIKREEQSLMLQFVSHNLIMTNNELKT
jgi:hypothetical protein